MIDSETSSGARKAKKSDTHISSSKQRYDLYSLGVISLIVILLRYGFYWYGMYRIGLLNLGAFL